MSFDSALSFFHHLPSTSLSNAGFSVVAVQLHFIELDEKQQHRCMMAERERKRKKSAFLINFHILQRRNEVVNKN
jgi:hypothetical protein